MLTPQRRPYPFEEWLGERCRGGGWWEKGKKWEVGLLCKIKKLNKNKTKQNKKEGTLS